MNTRFVSVNPPLTQHPGVARAEEVGGYFSVLGSQLSAALAQGWQAMCRRSADMQDANLVQGLQALRRSSAEAREDARFLAQAERDPRVMHELQVAVMRHGGV